MKKYRKPDSFSQKAQKAPHHFCGFHIHPGILKGKPAPEPQPKKTLKKV